MGGGGGSESKQEKGWETKQNSRSSPADQCNGDQYSFREQHPDQFHQN